MPSTSYFYLYILILCLSFSFSAHAEMIRESLPPIPLQKPKLDESNSSSSQKPKVLALIRGIIPTIKPLTKGMQGNRDLKKDIAHYKKIFDLQNAQKFKDADQEILKLKNTALIGHIFLHRYTHQIDSQVSFEDLADWLKKYGDHPFSHRIYKLAEHHMPKGYGYKLPEYSYPTYMRGSLEQQKTSKIFTPLHYQRTPEQEENVEFLKSSIQDSISEGMPTRALNALQKSTFTQILSQSEKDNLTIKIALSYLIEGKYNDAFNQASTVSDRHGEEMPLSGWVSGIAAWKQKRYALSALYFEKTASSGYADQWEVSAASYWAFRAHTQIGNKNRAHQWLKKATHYPRTFYGMIANNILEDIDHFNWDIPSFTHKRREVLFTHPRGERAYFLANIGLENLANMELEAIDPTKNPDLKAAMVSMAAHYKLSRFLIKFGNSFKQDNGDYYDSALYPELSSWGISSSQHKIDKALIHALIRQESSFKADANSSEGALGLMQILPSTAAFIMKNPAFKTSQKRALTNPKINIRTGEAYLDSLLPQSHINNNLFFLLIAYNAGPVNLSRWQNKIQDPQTIADPLLFIELIPSAETRNFVKYVMANLWIYRNQFEQNSPSLETISQNRWPLYQALD